jgi:ketosteroid isomerase-like protein
MKMTFAFAHRFAREWIEAWNSHDLARVLAHYTYDFEMSSPFIIEFAGEASGTLNGKTKVAAYWQAALQRMPNLHFELQHVMVGAASVVLVYQRNGEHLAGEAFYFNAQGLVERAAAHYSGAPM